MLFPTLALSKSGTVETIVSSQPAHKLPKNYSIFFHYNHFLYNCQSIYHIYIWHLTHLFMVFIPSNMAFISSIYGIYPIYLPHIRLLIRYYNYPAFPFFYHCHRKVQLSFFHLVLKPGHNMVTDNFQPVKGSTV